MIKTARQLKDLIRNLSREKSADAQLLMRNYMMERFLERISLSEYRDKFILKGGMLVAAMVGLDARSTMDLDATVKGANVNVEDIENLISAIVSVPIDDGVKFQLKSISEIMDEAEYPGIRVSMTTTFDGVVTPLKIDISTGDAITPREVRYSFKLMLEDRSIDIWAYNLESAAYLTNIAYGPASAYGIATIQHIRRAIHVFRFFMGTGIMLRYLSVVPTLGFEITRRCGNEQLTENGKISIIT